MANYSNFKFKDIKEVYGLKRNRSSSTQIKTVTYSGGKFFINAVTNPSIQLFKGETYRFDQSAASNASYTLRFSTTADPSPTSYTTGVTLVGTPGSAGAYTQIVVASDAPSTLYYYNTVTTNSGNTAYVADLFNSCSLTTTARGVDNISLTEFQLFGDVFLSSAGYTFTVDSSTGNLIVNT